MRFNNHSELKDKHAFLSASQYHWLGYDDEKLVARYATARAAQRGTELHAFAHEAVRLRMKQPNSGQTVPMYVNHCIGHNMQNEVPLVYSEYAFGTADAIDFRQMLLRIFDLKTGVTLASMKQLKVYAAFFCLEYKVKPFEIDYDLRIYQNDEIVYDNNGEGTDPEEIAHFMGRIKHSSNIIKEMREAEG